MKQRHHPAASKSRRSIIEERHSVRSLGWSRLVRTVALGTVAVFAALFWGAEQFGLQRELVLEFLTSSLLFVGFLVVAGLAGTVLLFAVRWLLRRRG